METTFKEHKIKVTADFRFLVDGPMFDRPVEFSSVDDARNNINQRLVAHAKQRKAEGSFALPALNGVGERVTIRGIHSSQGSLLGVGDTQCVYPDAPWIRDFLIHCAGLAKELAEIERKLKPFRTNTKRLYGRVRPEAYDEELSKLATEFNEKTEKAKEKQNV